MSYSQQHVNEAIDILNKIVVLDAVRAAGHTRFVLSSGCTLALETPAANLEALLRAPARLP